jgi:hypothetical protein
LCMLFVSPVVFGLDLVSSLFGTRPFFVVSDPRCFMPGVFSSASYRRRCKSIRALISCPTHLAFCSDFRELRQFSRSISQLPLMDLVFFVIDRVDFATRIIPLG